MKYFSKKEKKNVKLKELKEYFCNGWRNVRKNVILKTENALFLFIKNNKWNSLLRIVQQIL